MAESTCEAVFGVTPVALHPRERQRAHVADVPADRRHGRAPATQGPVRGDADDPRSVRRAVSPVCVHAHVHVVSPAKWRHPARAAVPAVSAVPVGETARAAIPAVGRVTVVRLVHLHSQHAAVLDVTQDLIDAEGDGLHVRVLLQMWSQYSYVVHDSRDPSPPRSRARNTVASTRRFLHSWLWDLMGSRRLLSRTICECSWRRTRRDRPPPAARGHQSTRQIDSARPRTDFWSRSTIGLSLRGCLYIFKCKWDGF